MFYVVHKGFKKSEGLFNVFYSQTMQTLLTNNNCKYSEDSIANETNYPFQSNTFNLRLY